MPSDLLGRSHALGLDGKKSKWQTLAQSLPFFAPSSGVGREGKQGTGLDRRLNGRVANELCHTKRKINADELARILKGWSRSSLVLASWV